jgi:type II secretory pathway component PulJ
MNRLRRNFRRRSALTLVELLIALSITTVVSTAALGMLHAGAQAGTTIQNSISTEWEVQTALFRMINQTRDCTSFNVPTSTSGGSSFSLVTQPDTANGNITYALTYSLVTAADGTSQLQESDPRYGSSVLVHNVQSFDVRYKSGTAPLVIVITLTAGNSNTVSRLVRVRPRNQ